MIVKKEDLRKLAKDILAKNTKIITMKGDLGTGKTTLTKEIAKIIGIEDFSIKSPTFTYIRRYPKHKFNHIDLYRLDEIDELLYLEIEELIAQNDYVIIEWAEKMEGLIQEKHLEIKLEHIDENARDITIKLID